MSDDIGPLVSSLGDDRPQPPRERAFLSALAFLDVQYGTTSSPDDPHWDDREERRALFAHARSMGWTAPEGLS